MTGAWPDIWLPATSGQASDATGGQCHPSTDNLLLPVAYLVARLLQGGVVSEWGEDGGDVRQSYPLRPARLLLVGFLFSEPLRVS